MRYGAKRDSDRSPIAGIADEQPSHLVAAPTSGGQSIDLQQVITTEPRSI